MLRVSSPFSGANKTPAAAPNASPPKNAATTFNISKSLRYYFFCAEKTFIAANPIWVLTDFNIISTIRCFYITTFASKF